MWAIEECYTGAYDAYLGTNTDDGYTCSPKLEGLTDTNKYTLKDLEVWTFGPSY